MKKLFTISLSLLLLTSLLLIGLHIFNKPAYAATYNFKVIVVWTGEGEKYEIDPFQVVATMPGDQQVVDLVYNYTTVEGDDIYKCTADLDEPFDQYQWYVNFPWQIWDENFFQWQAECDVNGSSKGTVYFMLFPNEP